MTESRYIDMIVVRFRIENEHDVYDRDERDQVYVADQRDNGLCWIVIRFRIENERDHGLGLI